MKTTRRYLEAIATAIGSKSNITLKEGERWVTDIRSKQITYNPQDLLNSDALVAKGLILHEVGHVNYTKNIEKSELQKQYPKAMQELYNIYEDIRIEEELSKDYGEFARQAVSATNISARSANRKMLKNGVEANNLQLLGQALLTCNAYELESDSYKRGQIATYYNEIKSKLPREIADELRKHLNDTTYQARRSNSTQEIKRLVDNEVYPHIKDLIKEIEEQKSKEGKGESKKGLEGNHGEKESHGHGQTTQRSGGEMSLSDEEIEMLLMPYVNTVAGKLNDILKEQIATRYEGQYKSGKLLGKNAYKILTGETRVFSRKNNPRKPKYTITLVLDESGSMNEYNRKDKTFVAGFLMEFIAKRLGFKCNVIIYDGNVRVEKSVSAYRRFRGGGNNDYQACQKVQAITDKTDDNLVFILTDGGVCEDPRPILEELYKDNYTVIAIGVGLDEEMTDQLREYYKNTIEAQDVEQLPAIMINQIQRLIHR